MNEDKKNEFYNKLYPKVMELKDTYDKTLGSYDDYKETQSINKQIEDLQKTLRELITFTTQLIKN